MYAPIYLMNINKNVIYLHYVSFYQWLNEVEFSVDNLPWLNGAYKEMH